MLRQETMLLDRGTRARLADGIVPARDPSAPAVRASRSLGVMKKAAGSPPPFVDLPFRRVGNS